MKKVSLSPTIISIIPAIAIIPVISTLLNGLHNGGVQLLFKFFLASLQPSFESAVIQSALRGIQITIAIALISWATSIIGGLLLGLISSKIFWKSVANSEYNAIIIKRLLAIPRSIHELIWGLLLLQFFGINPWIAILAIFIPYSAILARVFADQLDNLDHSKFFAVKQVGVQTGSAFLSVLFPPMIPIISSYGGYRLECALRGATILGIFGMGGIGTEIQLTFQSLEFRELWTSLWILAAVTFSLERLINIWRKQLSKNNNQPRQIITFGFASFLLTLISFFWLEKLDIHLFQGWELHGLPLPTFFDLVIAFQELNWINLIGNTIVVTLLAAGIAIGIPPLLMMLWPTNFGLFCQSITWSFLRLIPPPLSALLLLLCTSPNICVASLALGLQNLGVMGRLLKEGIESQNNDQHIAIYSSGTSNNMAWLYGNFTPQSKSYLAYGAYRTDVILRETAIVGVVGGAGLGWQLQESLSSFDWPQVVLITAAYAALTLIGEAISAKSSQNLVKSRQTTK